MAHRVVPALAFAFLLGAGQAIAQGSAPAKPAGPSWPDNLKHRNARYASFTRVDDAQGDAQERVLAERVLAHQQLLAHTQTVRVDDRLGDLDQEARARLANHRPPREASVFARLERVRDESDDQRQIVVAGLPGTRRFAETRRFRDLGGDQLELTIYKQERERRILDDDRTLYQADQEERVSRGRYIETRDDIVEPTETEGPRELERVAESEAERETERSNVRGEAATERMFDRQQERDLEQLTDQEADRADERAEDEADGDLEREGERIEDSTERSDETQDERSEERQTERQQTRDDEQATGDE